MAAGKSPCESSFAWFRLRSTSWQAGVSPGGSGSTNQPGAPSQLALYSSASMAAGSISR